MSSVLKRLPLIPTIFVAFAIATMIGLGVWQLQRAEWKRGILDQAASVQNKPPVRGLSLGEHGHAFRQYTTKCSPGRKTRIGVRGGRNIDDEPGWLLVTDCQSDDVAPYHSPSLLVVVGWSRDPKAPESLTINKTFTGTLVEDPKGDGRIFSIYTLVPTTAVSPYKPAAQPTPAEIPNNHLFYAAQWFFFAAAAGVIYALALRKRWIKPQS